MLKNGHNLQKDIFYDDEIDLVEYLRIIIKRKAVIFFTILISVLISVFLFLIVDFLKPKVYDAVSVVQLGVVKRPITDITSLALRIKADRFLDRIIKELGLKETPSQLSDMLIVRETSDPNLIQIVARHKQPITALKICNIATYNLVSENKLIYKSRFDQLNEEIRICEERIKDIKGTKAEIKKNNLSASAVGTVELSSIMKSIREYEIIYNEILAKKDAYEEQLLNARDFEFYQTTRLLPDTRKLNIIRNLILACNIGLMLGLLVVFLQEFRAKDIKRV